MPMAIKLRRTRRANWSILAGLALLGLLIKSRSAGGTPSGDPAGSPTDQPTTTLWMDIPNQQPSAADIATQAAEVQTIKETVIANAPRSPDNPALDQVLAAIAAKTIELGILYSGAPYGAGISYQVGQLALDRVRVSAERDALWKQARALGYVDPPDYSGGD